MHQQVCIKVNAWVDEKIAPVIEAMAKIDGLITFDSCQNLNDNGEAFIIFQYGNDYKDWKKLGEICEKLSKALIDIEYAKFSITWQTACCNFPEGFLTFKTTDANKVASAILKLCIIN